MTNSFKYIYSFKYDVHHSELCKLESRQVFDEEVQEKLLFSNKKVDPSISPFIKSRLDILTSSGNYSTLIKKISSSGIKAEGFKAEYLVLADDGTSYTDRLQKLREIGHSIEGEPDYDRPSIIYSICNYGNIWYFGILTKNNTDWQKHKKKPQQFSNAISMNIAKTLVSIATQGNSQVKLLDACCGVGTVMLEACFSGFNIEGCDINWKACKNTRENLSYFNYSATVFRSDIKDIDKRYDAGIIDLPYNLTTYSDDAITLNIISSTAKLSDRIVIVSISDIAEIIKASDLEVIDFCEVEKRGKSNFSRSIWVCKLASNELAK